MAGAQHGVEAVSARNGSGAPTGPPSIRATVGFIVHDAGGRLVGRVEAAMYGTSPDEPDALAVRTGRVFASHFIVPAVAIEAVDDEAHAIVLLVERRRLRRFF